MKRVEEEVPHLLDKRGDVAKRQRGKDIILIPMEVLVCQNCGERYYDRKTMLKLEEMRDRLTRKDVELEGVGKVLRAKMA